MHRYFFYFAVAMVTFGMGVIVAAAFYAKEEKAPVVPPRIKENSIPPAQTFAIEKTELPKQKIDFKCTDKILSDVWKHLRKNGYIDAEVNFANCAELISVSKMIDLNGDGIDEAIVEGIHLFMNGARGNKSIFISQKIGRTYKIILEEREQEFEIKENVTNGYRDIYLRLRDDCCASYQTTYKFSKGNYKESKCLYVNYGTTGIKEVSSCKGRER